MRLLWLPAICSCMQTAPHDADDAALLPAIIVSSRPACREGARMRYQETVGYVPEGPDRPRSSPEEKGRDMRAEMGPEGAIELARNLVLASFVVDPKELRFEMLGVVHRGSSPTFEMHSVQFRQVFRNAWILAGGPGGFAGADVDVHGADDWDMRAAFVEVRPLPGTARKGLSKEEAYRIACERLHFNEQWKHERSMVLAYCPAESLTDFDSPLKPWYGACFYPAKPSVDGKTRHIPVWIVHLQRDGTDPLIRSWHAAHQGGRVTLNAWTGEVLAGDPRAPDWPKDATYWERAEAAASDWSSLPASIRPVIERLRHGMSKERCDEILAPITEVKAETLLGGTGATYRRYRLIEKLEATLGFPGPGGSGGLRGDVLWWVNVGPRKKWWGERWDPTPADVERAKSIAADQAKRVPAIAGGDPEKLSIWGTGRIWGNRVLELHYDFGDRRVAEILVDMDAGVVPSDWTPTEADLVRARMVGDPIVKDYLRTFEQGRSVVVEGRGVWDYESGHRLLWLSYGRTNDDLGGRSVLLDFDAGTEFRSD